MSKLVQSKRTDSFIYLKNIFLKKKMSMKAMRLLIYPFIHLFFSAVTVSRESSSTISLKKSPLEGTELCHLISSLDLLALLMSLVLDYSLMPVPSRSYL